MNTQPPTKPNDDRLWRWDGQQWQPATPKPYWTRRKIALAAGAWLLTVFGSCGIGAASVGSPKPAPAPTTQAAVATAKPTLAPATVTPTVAPATPTVAPATPKPVPQLINLEGQGAKVQEIDLSKSLYKFSWRVEASQFENFAIYLEGTDKRLLVNELVGQSQFSGNNPSSGETTVNVGGGHFVLSVKCSTTKWWVTFTPLS